MAIRSKFKFIRFIIILIIISFGLYKGFMTLFIEKESTYTAKYDQIYLEKKYNGLMIRNEKIFSSDVKGDLKYFINDGDVVKKGQLVANIQLKQNGKKNLENQENLSRDIEDIRRDELIKINREIDSLKSKILLATKLNDLKKIVNLEEKLRLKLDLKDKIKNNKIENFNLSEVSHNSQENNQVKLYSNYSGIISKSFDGLEKQLTLSKLYLIDYPALYHQEIKNTLKTSGTIEKNEHVYRIIDNYSYYIAYMIPYEDIKLYKNNINEVKVLIGEGTYEGKIYDCFESENGGVLVVEFNEYFPNFYKNRKMKNIVIGDQFQGIKLHKDSIVSKDGVKGVFRKDINHNPEFIPIKILNEVEKYVIVEENFFYLIDETGKKEMEKVNSIKINDEIYRKGNLYLNK